VSGARQRIIDALRRDPKRAEQLALMMTDRTHRRCPLLLVRLARGSG